MHAVKRRVTLLWLASFRNPGYDGGRQVSAVSDLMGVLLPGGLAVGAITLVQAYKTWREGRHSREETVIERLQRQLREADKRIEIAEQDEAYAIVVADHWMQRSAELEFRMRENGLTPPPRPPLPVRPKRQGEVVAQTRRRRNRAAAVDEEPE